jgi:hypothetical protein
LLFGEDVRTHFSDENNPTWQQACFAAERYLENARERELLEDISEKLTALSHLVARERLGVLKELIRQAERMGNEEVLMKHLKETKEAEELLQSNIYIEKR